MKPSATTPAQSREPRLASAQPPCDRREEGQRQHHAQKQQRGRRDRMRGVGQLDEDRAKRECEHPDQRECHAPGAIRRLAQRRVPPRLSSVLAFFAMSKGEAMDVKSYYVGT